MKIIEYSMKKLKKSTAELQQVQTAMKKVLKNPKAFALDWEEKWLDDRSGYWYSATVPILQWEYIVEVMGPASFTCGVFYCQNCCVDMSPCSKKSTFKKFGSAVKACEKHLRKKLADMASMQLK
jgi:hypothetical protein